MFSPSHPSGTSVSVGWSKLCHSTLEEFPPSRRTRFPLSRITAVFDPGDDDDGRDADDRLDDHTVAGADDGGLARPTSSRLPSSADTRSLAEATSERGAARLPTQMTIWTWMFFAPIDIQEFREINKIS